MEEGRLDLEEGNTCWYCGGCRARSAAAVGTRNAESFRSKHGRSCGGEITRIVRHAVEATPVSGPPCSIEGLIEEVQAARRDETLITPGLDFVSEVLSTVQRMDTSQMSGKAAKDEEVERMYRRRCEFETGPERASKLSELEAALAVTTGKKRISGRARSEIYKVLSDRGLIRPALLRRAAPTAAELEMTPQFITVDLNHGEADKRQFGALQLSYRQLMPILFKLLSHPALNLKEDLCTEVENMTLRKHDSQATESHRPRPRTGNHCQWPSLRLGVRRVAAAVWPSGCRRAVARRALGPTPSAIRSRAAAGRDCRVTGSPR